MARPIVFIPLILVGSAIVVATGDVPRTAPLSRTWVPYAGGGMIYVGGLYAVVVVASRWPRAQNVVRVAYALLSLGAVIIGFAVITRAISQVLVNCGIWSIVTMYLSGDSWVMERRRPGSDPAAPPPADR